MSKKEFKSEVIERVATLKETNGYTKEVIRMIWGDNDITMDIRMVNKANDFIGKGISLSDEECDKLVDVLLDRGYGSIDKIKEVLVLHPKINTSYWKRKRNLNLSSKKTMLRFISLHCS